MLQLAPLLWGWYAGALAIGFATGWISVVRRGSGLSHDMQRRIAIVIAGVLAVALLRLLPGRVGYAIDLGLMLLACYAMGCVIGAWLRTRVVAG
jgi:hypothetical protein